MTEKTPGAGKLSAWVKQNRLVIVIAISAIAAVGTVLSGISDWFSKETVILTQPSTEPRPATEEAKVSNRHQHVQQLYEVARGRMRDFDYFLFADHERNTGTEGRSTVYIYAANAETFVEIDEQACSYPDATQIETKPEQRALIVSCSFPDWFGDSTAQGDNDYAYAVTVIRLFDSDKEIVGSMSCECSSVVISSVDFNRKARSILFTIYTTGTLITPAGLSNADIALPRVEDSRSSGPARVFEMRFDTLWNPESFKLVSPAR